MPFTIATWNINSVRLRQALVAKLMQEEAPDILCLQECKSPVEKIPVETFHALSTPMSWRGVRRAITASRSSQNPQSRMRAIWTSPDSAMPVMWPPGSRMAH